MKTESKHKSRRKQKKTFLGLNDNESTINKNMWKIIKEALGRKFIAPSTYIKKFLEKSFIKS